ncbi:hypothetical protein [Dactylosporangium salmoneum]|uniref:Uncharacterized protein n=1 Tax=Dactylosporangium salmoneum TaxID=53361 RepID=A0ABN3I7I3_9ACTN
MKTLPSQAAPAVRLTWRIVLAAAFVTALAAGLISTVLSAIG